MLFGEKSVFVRVLSKEVFVPLCLLAISRLGSLDAAKLLSCWERARDGGTVPHQP